MVMFIFKVNVRVKFSVTGRVRVELDFGSVRL